MHRYHSKQTVDLKVFDICDNIAMLQVMLVIIATIIHILWAILHSNKNSDRTWLMTVSPWVHIVWLPDPSIPWHKSYYTKLSLHFWLPTKYNSYDFYLLGALHQWRHLVNKLFRYIYNFRCLFSQKVTNRCIMCMAFL